jgi:bifunctional aspartokinase / homoserine dehydrogenase 1
MIVVKFGGSSLATSERMIAAAHIVAKHRQRQPVVCVVSAMQGVTDQLIEIARLAQSGSAAWHEQFAHLCERHERTYREIADPGLSGQQLSVTPLLDSLAHKAGYLAGGDADAVSADAIAVFSAWGERLAVRLFATALARVGLEAAVFEDAPVIVERGITVDTVGWSASVRATGLWLCDPIRNLLKLGQTPVLPGYLALRQDGEYITLGRNGSDQSAAVVGAALEADAVYLYSDVAGIYAADPRREPRAPLLRTLSYEEAAAIAASGARVLHPATLPPLAQAGIPLHLRSVFDPDAPGTDIGLQACARSTATVEADSTLVPALAGSGPSIGKAGRRDA